MAKGILLGGLLGGLAMFVWGFLSHEVLKIAETGLSSIPNEQTVVPALKSAIHEPGLYFIPALEESPGQSKEQAKAAQERFAQKVSAGPYGLLVYHPEGAKPMGVMLVIELLSNIGCALVAGFLLSRTGASLPSYGSRVLFVTLLGLAAWLSIELSYWNWYGFPGDYSMAQLVDQLAGFALTGLVVAKLVKAPTS